MKSISYLILAFVLFSSCDDFFEIEQTVHKIGIVNNSDTDIGVQWRVGVLNETFPLDASGTDTNSTGSTIFFSEDGDANEMEVSELYTHFDELLIVIQSGDESSNIELESLQINPEIRSDDFMSTQEWYYTFTITNETLMQLN